MPQTIIADMDSWKRIAGNADADGAFTIMVFDAEAKGLLEKLLTAINGVRARLDGGIKVQSGTIAINI